ncbi:MAG TPA: NAD-dependent malic enzyme [Blastocatellia bacterium]|nr:NAD-dependent malic enzyme [Blastocatellia bacterium]
MDEHTGEEVLEVSLAGQLLLDYPLLNKGMAFTDEERREFGLLGLLPPHVSTVEGQLARNYENYRRKESDIERYIFLMALQDRNETLFYKLLGHHISEMMPIIYTPVVGAASQLYSHIYRRPRGLYISYRNRGEIKTLLSNAPHPDAAIIVVTDGERVLGLGDLGVGGMGIPVGKLSLYTLCAGIHPATTLPVFLDVGTGNQGLLNDPLYIGWRHERVRGREYDDFIEEFIEAVTETFPGALLQWEDFARHNARRLLERYQDRLCSFNDDIQGTGAVTLAGLLAAVKVNGERLSDQRIVMFGAGSAATGIADQIVAAVVSEGIGEGCSEQEAKQRLWMIDVGGLVHTGRDDIDEISRPFAQPFERIADWRVADRNHVTLAEVVKHLRPTALIGTAAQPGAFTQDVVEEMARHVARPIIFPLSNPTSRSEAKPVDLLAWTSGRAIIATGSPFADVSQSVTGGGRPRKIGQCNNAYIFPGVGLGVIASGARQVRQEMFVAAARALSDMSPALSDRMASLFPDLNAIREVSRRVAIAVGLEAQALGLARATTREELAKLVEEKMWTPRYLRYRRKAD